MGELKVSPLEGITVLACEQVLAGPYCTMLLAYQGAEVIKVEPPGKGDMAREYPPCFIGEDGNKHSLYFASLNMNKKSVSINLKDPRGRELMLRLVEKADVLVSNFRPKTMDRLGLGYETCSLKNPSLIYTTISGFGYPGVGGTSPYWSRPAFDIIAQAAGGLMGVTGKEGGQPTRAGISIGDISAGIFAALGTVGALLQREKTGRGQHVDVSMVDSVVALMGNAVCCYEPGGLYSRPVGNRHPALTPFDSFVTKDGHVVIAAASERAWKALCRAMGRPDLITDERFLSNELRLENHRELKAIIEDWTQKFTTNEVIDMLTEEGCPAGPVNTISDLLTGAHTRARNMIVQRDFWGKTANVIGSPIKYSESEEAPVKSRPPYLGEDTEHVLSSFLGLSREKIEKLRFENVIQTFAKGEK